MRKTRRKPSILGACAVIVSATLLAITLVGCGDEDAPRSLSSLLLDRSELPRTLPKLRESASNAGLNKFAKATGVHSAGQTTQLKRQLKSHGFVRGSARRYQSRTGDARILILIESVTEMKDGDASKKMVEQTFKRAGKKPNKIDIELGDFSRSYKIEAANIPVYVFAWKKGKLFYFFSLSSNRNGGPSQKAVERLAEKLAEKNEKG